MRNSVSARPMVASEAVSGLVQLEPHVDDIAAAPLIVDDLSECFFYHTTDVPGSGVGEGEWDLRGGEEAYLGRAPFAGTRVLELGTAAGFLTFHMEGRGAEVVSYDPTPALR